MSNIGTPLIFKSIEVVVNPEVLPFIERPPAAAAAPVYSMVWIYQFGETIPVPEVTLDILKVGAFNLEVATHVHLSDLLGPIVATGADDEAPLAFVRLIVLLDESREKLISALPPH